MKLLQNNFTSPEQSKRLLELGLPADSADMFYPACLDWSSVIPTILNIADKPQVGVNLHEYPCWSVGRLIEIFSYCFCYSYGRDFYKDYARYFLNMGDFIDEVEKNIKAINEFNFSKLEE